ncbi:MAG: hypothetical protein ACLSXJ_06905 [Clostridium saudiense]|uniref:hypothetical protein n=1 Tax=Clostridium saudiense TaxID=1414720 RepID=UPI0039930701
MINTYKNKSIIYNGRNLSQLYDLYVVDEDIELESDLGVTQSANLNNGALINLEKDTFTFSLKFIRKINGKLASLDGIYLGRSFIEEISRVFFDTSKDGVNILELGGRVYYVSPTSGTLKRYSRSVSEFTIEFESLSPYAYSPIMVSSIRVLSDNSPKTIEITNRGNDTYLELEVECVQTGTLTISNNGEELVINANAGDIAKVNGDTAEVSDYSKVAGNIRDSLMLIYGSNNVSISTDGDFKVVFRYQCEYALC